MLWVNSYSLLYIYDRGPDRMHSRNAAALPYIEETPPHYPAIGIIAQKQPRIMPRFLCSITC